MLPIVPFMVLHFSHIEYSHSDNFSLTTMLSALAEYDEIQRRSLKQKEALSKIIEGFLSAFES